jgi:hypothetical protein
MSDTLARLRQMEAAATFGPWMTGDSFSLWRREETE